MTRLQSERKKWNVAYAKNSIYNSLLIKVLLVQTNVAHVFEHLFLQDTSIGLVSLNEDGSESRRIDQYGRYVNANKDIVYDKQYANRIIRDIDDCNGSTALSIPSILLLLASSLIALCCSTR